ncbi:cellulose binding domain-containing protein [Clostridium oceanicum]|uniref:chitinase n=1 Tax=Clostridium oceanicum TaxID=1543 RepID=A0ABN1JCP2_9CLOT
MIKTRNFDVVYYVASQWEYGFIGEITIKNTSEEVIAPWKLKFHFKNKQEIIALWNGSFTQRGKEVVIENANYNKKISPGESIHIGFCANTFGINEKPTDFTLNGKRPILDFGFLEIVVKKPSFNEEIFVPEVTIDNIKTKLNFGEKINFQLIDGHEYAIKSKVYKDENYIYKPFVSEEKIMIEKSIVKKVFIEYEKKPIDENINFDVKYSIESEWDSGFTGKIIIENTGDLVITPWKLQFDFKGDQKITSLWNGIYTQEEKKVTINNDDYNKEIKPGGVVSIGFTASFSGVNEKPDNFKLNNKSPVIEYGFVEVTVEKPSFDQSIFKPKVRIASITKQIYWGDKYKFKVESGREYNIEANSFKDGIYIYKPSIKPKTVIVKANENKKVSVSYEELESNENIFCGYFPSWKEHWVSSGDLTDLANLPSYVNRVILAFAKPDMIYNGDYDISKTGLEFPYDATVLKEAIIYLKKKNPETNVLLSVGGATYVNWKGFNEKDIARFVKDFNLDGVDIDYEPNREWGCKPDKYGVIYCKTDNEYVSLIEKIRRELKRPYIISAAPLSVGAYGQGKFKDSPPASLDSTGMMLDVISRASNKLDIINVQGYNAGPEFNPLEATEAYSYYFKGSVAMGVMVPPEDFSTGKWTIDKIEEVGDYINENNLGGMMLWDLYRKTKEMDSQTMASAIAKSLGFENYKETLFPLHRKE